MPSKEDYYKNEDWERKGDAFKRSPHLDHMYRCLGCGDHVQVKTELQDLGACKEAIVQCLTCQQTYVVLIDKRYLKGGK